MRRARPRRGALPAALALVLLASPAGAQAPRRVRIGASGDVLFHTRVVAAAAAQGGFDPLLSGLRAVISDDEVAFANLETPLSMEHAPMRGNPPGSEPPRRRPRPSGGPGWTS